LLRWQNDRTYAKTRLKYC